MYDVIVVGARVAGSPTAMLLARAGHRVLLLDRETFPSDTLSTSYMHPDPILRMRRWGLYDRLAAAGTPGIPAVNFAVGDMEMVSPNPVPTHAPRRFILDQILVDGAREAGAELREGCSVQEVLKDENGSVIGVRMQDSSGKQSVEHCRVLVGADGRNSVVAKAVNPEQTEERPGLTTGYYSIYEGFGSGDATFFIKGNHLQFIFPTNNDSAIIGFEAPAERFATAREDPEAYLFSQFDQNVPAYAERLRAAKRTDKLFGFGTRGSYYRKPYGPGWALVGDAGFLKDPVLGDGINDAFRDADGLATALVAGLSGRQPLVEALSSYEAERNASSRERYDLAHDFCAALTGGFTPELVGRFGESTAKRAAVAMAQLAAVS